jgi:uncharacterized protein (TIGR00255 family)
MLRSMTAHAVANYRYPGGRFDVRIHSVNRKQLEIKISLPQELEFLEAEVRRWVSQKIGRGSLVITVAAIYDAGCEPYQIELNTGLAQRWLTAWRQINEELELAFDEKAAGTMLWAKEDLFVINKAERPQEEIKYWLEQAIEQSLDELQIMKQREGAILLEDIDQRVEHVKELTQLILQNSSEATSKLKIRLEERLKQAGIEIVSDERIAREVVLLAERSDYTEEIIRLQAHLDYFSKLLLDSKPDKGKTLDFLVQESLRELNTLTAKASDVIISHYAVDGKAELERIREQLQNVE